MQSIHNDYDDDDDDDDDNDGDGDSGDDGDGDDDDDGDEQRGHQTIFHPGSTSTVSPTTTAGAHWSW